MWLFTPMSMCQVIFGWAINTHLRQRGATIHESWINSESNTGFPWLKRRRGSSLFAPLSVCAFLQPVAAAVIALLSHLLRSQFLRGFVSSAFRHERSEICPTKLVLGSRPQIILGYRCDKIAFPLLGKVTLSFFWKDPPAKVVYPY